MDRFKRLPNVAEIQAAHAEACLRQLADELAAYPCSSTETTVALAWVEGRLRDIARQVEPVAPAPPHERALRSLAN